MSELERLHDESWGWALSRCGYDRDAAEDVMQMSYLKVLEGKARFRGESSLKTWLFGVIRNVALARHRQLRTRLRRLQEFVLTTDNPQSGHDQERRLEGDRASTAIAGRIATSVGPSARHGRTRFLS